MIQKYHNFFLWRGNLEKGLPKNRPDNLEDNDVEMDICQWSGPLGQLVSTICAKHR